MLRVEQLSVRYGETVALDHVDLTVADHEIVCVLGPSGSGKSTLLRAIAGLAPEATGRVERDGDDIASLPPHRRGFGLMFQDHALFPHRDALGNVAFGLRMQRLPREQVDRRAHEALALVGLQGFERRRIDELSGGEQQRVALARALAPAPSLLMLDEPLGALDRALRERLVVELRELFVRLGLAVLFVTHDHDEAFALADRVVVMHNGRVEQTGSPRDVWERPATVFVAEFLGWNVTTAFGGTTTAVRPEHVAITATGNGCTAEVTGRTFRRDRVRVHLRVADGSTLDASLDLDVPAPDVGATVGLVVEPGHLVRFG